VSESLPPLPGVQSSPNSLLGRWLERRRRHPGEIDCAIRVVSGTVEGESARWSYRRSAFDPLVVDGVRVFVHGTTRLRLRFGDEVGVSGHGVRPRHVVLDAAEADTGAAVQWAGDRGVAAEAGLI
jgi:hypothetical protein